MRLLLNVFLVTCTTFVFSGCASIFLGTKQEVEVKSNVDGAMVYLNGRNTGQVTPTTITVRKRNASKTDKTSKKYELKKNGYQTFSYVDQGRSKGGYMVGNIVFWPGFIIDASSCAQYQFEEAIYAQLEPIEGYEFAQVNTNVPTSRGSASVNTEAVAGLPEADSEVELNKRELIKRELDKIAEGNEKLTAINSTKTINNRASESLRETKLSNSELNIDETLKYRRSSLYTLMTHDPSRMYEQVVLDAFGNSDLSENFDDHNIGPYLINTNANIKDQIGFITDYMNLTKFNKDPKIKDKTQVITNYLNKEGVARSLVAKWFNRDVDGVFDMALIADRGKYDASVFDANLAEQTSRGNAMLADAGEELINKTFVVVHDLNFTDKEEVAGKAKKGLKFIGQVAEMAGVDYADAIGTIAGEALGVAGKGYVVKTRTYLFRLDWNDEVAKYFYQNHWVDSKNVDPAKIESFNKSDKYQLKYVGSEVAWADVQSSTMSNKTNEQLIEKATNKAIDKALANLQKEFDEFRVKTPLVGVEPLKAKIGMKEGLEKGDRFEVLEQVQDENGRTTYKRKGIITVDKNRIWDNRYEATEDNPEANDDPYTYFKGIGNFYPGMLIRQIN